MQTALYCRISRDPNDHRLGVARQEIDCRARADALGWSVVEVLVDNDVSAYSGKRRPAYERLLEGLREKRYHAVIAWAPDRLHRSPKELEAFIDLVELVGAQVVTVQAGNLDLSTASGRMTARVVGAVARHESEHKADRIRRKHLELAQDGKNAGGGTRPFGFNDDRVTLRADEADIIRELAGRVIAGETIRTLCNALTARGVHTVTGKPWHPHVLKSMLVSARIAGLRDHKGKITAAKWPAIIDADQHYKLRAILLDEKRRVNRSPRRYLLSSGLVRCALCGAALVARPRADKSRCYVCATGPGFAGCGKIRVLADPLEELVAIDMLTSIENVTTVHVATDLPTEADPLEAIEMRLRDLAEMWAAGTITKDEWTVARESLTDQLDAARSAMVTEAHATVDLADYRGRWETLDIDQKRLVIGAVIEHVIVGPAVRGRNRFDPDRVDYAWRA